MADKTELVRIEYEYADGSARRAVGADARAIDARIAVAIVQAWAHGERFDDLPKMQPVPPDRTGRAIRARLVAACREALAAIPDRSPARPIVLAALAAAAAQED
jgi:hypothetical protein